MGDADIPQAMMTAQELEIMEDTLNEIEDKMSRCFLHVELLNDRTNNIMREVVSCQKIRSFFIPFSLFVVPIILGIVVTFGAIELIEVDSYANDCLGAFVMFLMCLSGFIGLPMYIYALWDVYFTTIKIEEISINREQCAITLAPKDTDTNASRTTLSADTDEPFDAISEFRRWIECQIEECRVAELERKINLVDEAEHESMQELEFANFGTRQVTEAQNVNVVTAASEESIDVGFDRAPRTEETILEKEEDVCGAKRSVNADRNFSVEIEKGEETSESVKNREPVTDEIKMLDFVGNISAENVGEGDSNVVLKLLA